jgi:hypothetical protein
MTKEELNKVVETNLDFARVAYSDPKSDGLSTMLIIKIVKNSEESNIVAVFGDNESLEQRWKTVFDLGVRINLEKFRGEIDSVEGIFMLTEAWMSMINKNDPQAKVKINRMPSQDPNKIEAIVSAGSSRDGLAGVRTYEIRKSFDIVNSEIKTEFIPMDKDGPIEAETPLLKQFWNGIELMEIFERTLPKELEDHMKKMPVEQAFNLLISQLEKIENYEHRTIRR